VQLTWIGHATVLIEMDGTRVLTDPVLGRRTGLLRRVVAPARGSDAERIDAVLVSHLHADHVDLPSLSRVGAGVPIVASPTVADWLQGRGFDALRRVATGESTDIGGVAIEATPARHDGRRWPRGKEAEPLGFVIRGALSIYFAGDTDLFPEMSDLSDRVDVALIPIWGWGPTLGPGHLDPERAAEAVAIVRPRLVIPIHWGTLAPLWTRRSATFLTSPAEAFVAAAAKLAPEVEVRLLQPGENVSLEPGSGVVRAPRRQAGARGRASAGGK